MRLVTERQRRNDGRRRAAEQRHQLAPPHEHLPRKRILLWPGLKHGSTRTASSTDTGVDGVRGVREGQEPGLRKAVSYSITSSARARSFGGIVRPSSLAVFR